jgi:hypothetical protein
LPERRCVRLADIADSRSHEIAGPELAVDREIEERKFTGVSLQLNASELTPACSAALSSAAQH